jgi:hypothetical protein
MIKKQFTLYLENKPGALSSVMVRLAKKHVNIEGVSVAASPDAALVQLVVSNAAETKRVLARAGIPFTEQAVCVLPLANRPGALASVADRIAKSGININYLYATACEALGGCRSYAIISAPNLKKVVSLWRAACGA